MFGEKSFHNKVTNSMFRSKHTQYSWPGMNNSLIVFYDLLNTDFGSAGMLWRFVVLADTHAAFSGWNIDWLHAIKWT